MTYDGARVLYNARFDAIRPAAIARCRSVDDVRACVGFAATYDVPLALRSGGHSYGGWSTGMGLVIDTAPLNAIDVRGDHAIVGAGVKLIDLYGALGAVNASVPGGSCATVGVAGLALGGGIGVMSRSWGLLCDDIVAADIVTADGRVASCDGQREPDLYWALRGGGAGSFGVVTSLTLRTHPVGSLAVAFLSWPWTSARTVIAAWQDFMGQAPDALWSNLHLDGDSGGAQLTLYAVHAGTTASLATQLDRLDALSGIRASRSLALRSFSDVTLIDAGCFGRTVSQCHLAGQTPDGTLERDTYAASSIVANAPLSADAIAALIKGFDPVAAGTAYSVIYDALGGAVSRVAPDATAFPYRGALGVLQFVVHWSDASHQSDALTALRSHRAEVAARSSNAAYANYADPDLADWPQAYYGANYPRLQRVKRTYDPGDLFRFPQSIKP